VGKLVDFDLLTRGEKVERIRRLKAAGRGLIERLRLDHEAKGHETVTLRFIVVDLDGPAIEVEEAVVANDHLFHSTWKVEAEELLS
jgi:hypothetical protein